MSEFALEVQSVSKTFGTKPAVKSVSFGARTGEITGFLGPNGAGKTTCSAPNRPRAPSTGSASCPKNAASTAR